MLQNFRDHIHGWISGIVIGILVLAFALWGIQYYLSSSGGTQTVAKVNKQAITQVQLDNAYQRYRQRQAEAGGTANLALDQTEQIQLKEKVLQQLIEKNILADAAAAAGYQVSSELIDAVILQTPAFQVNGQFSPERYQQALSLLMFSPQQFALDIMQTLLALQVQTSIAGTDFALPSEVNEVISLNSQRRDFGYFLIPASRFLATENVNAKDVQTYYTEHQRDFMTPEKVSIQYIELSAKQLADKQQVSEQEISQYYQNNLSSFTKPEQWQIARVLVLLPHNASAQAEQAAQSRLQQIQQQLKSGKTFAEVASQYSDDKASAAKGGLLEWISKGLQPSTLTQVVASLQPDQVSAPFRTLEGYNIIKLLAVKKAQVLSLAEVHDQIKKTLQQQKIEQEFADQSDKLTNLTYTNPDTLKVAADSLGLPIQTTDLFTRQGAKSGIATKANIVNAAFSDNVLKQNNNSDVIQLDSGTLIVLRVNQYIPSKLQPLADVSEQIINQLKTQAAKISAKNLGEKVTADLQAGKAAEQIAKQYNLVWNYQTNVTRQQPSINAQVLQTAFSLPQPVTKQIIVGSVAIPNGDYAVIQLMAVEEVNANLATAQQRSVVRNELVNTWGQFNYDLYIRGAKSHARVKINPITSEQTN